MNVYSFNVVDLSGNEVSLEKYSGKTLLIVNTASKGIEKHELYFLEEIQKKYSSKGLSIICFPCRQFLKREYKDVEKIKHFYTVKNNFSFDVYNLIKVNGPNTHPLYKWLKKQCPGFFGTSIEWNYTKFLVKSDGTTVYRFTSVSSQESLENCINECFT